MPTQPRQQLLCIMAPATQIPLLRLDSVAGDVLEKLRGLGDNRQIPVRPVRALTEYLDRYTAPDGTPISTSVTLMPAIAVDESAWEGL